MRSARQDKIRGGIDKIAGRVLDAFGKLTGNRSTRVKGKAARVRGAGRSAKGRVKGHGL
ncbi:MAG: CsbD family protein [Solirubrobacterales bacterium]|nr:CsbD family protein [Solirubrobacterales bacterium]